VSNNYEKNYQQPDSATKKLLI